MTNTVLSAMGGIDEGYLAECEAIRAGGLPPKKTPQLPSWLEMLGYVALILIVLGSVIVVPGMLRRQPQESVGSESNTETDTTEDTEPPESEPTQSMDLNRYMRSLVGFFYEPCDKPDPKAYRNDILCLLFSFCEDYGEQLGFADWDEARADESLLVIQGEGLRKVGKMLLGDDFNPWDYHDTLDWGEYVEETDTYEVSFGTDYRGGELVVIVFGTQLTITETADGAEVVVALRFDDLGDIASTDEGIPDAPPVFFLRYTFRSVVSDGFRYYRLISIAAVDDLTLPTTPLTAAQLQAFEDFLNDPATNGFVGYNFYSSPDKIDLNAVFYDGAGIGIPSWEWDDEEKQGVLDAVGWEEYFTTAIKIPRAEADRLLQERLGLSLADFDNKIPHFHFVEAYDAYYDMHGDTNLLPITVLGGEIDKNGRYIVRYANEDYLDEVFTVTLCRTDEGFRFLSNVSDEEMDMTETEDTETTESETTPPMTEEPTDIPPPPAPVSAPWNGKTVTIAYDVVSGSVFPDDMRVMHFHHGYAVIYDYGTDPENWMFYEEGDSWNYLDTEGNRLLSKQYTELTDFHEDGLAVGRLPGDEEQYVFLNTKGEEVGPATYDDFNTYWDYGERDRISNKHPEPEEIGLRYNPDFDEYACDGIQSSYYLLGSLGIKNYSNIWNGLVLFTAETGIGVMDTEGNVILTTEYQTEVHAYDTLHFYEDRFVTDWQDYIAIITVTVS